MRVFKRLIAALLVIILTSSFVAYAANRKEVELVTPPNRTVFYEGKDWGYVKNNIVEYSNLDLSGASVNYEGNIIRYYKFPWGPNMYASPVSGKWAVGKNPIYIYLDDIDSFNGELYALSEVTFAGIKKIEIVTQPAKTTLIETIDWHYDKSNSIVLDNIDLTGLSIKITYTDNTSETLVYSDLTKDSITCAVPESTDSLVLGKNRFLIKYADKSADIYFDFQKEQIVRASLAKSPDQIDYHYKTNWKYVNSKITPTINLKGLTVTAVYNTGKKETVSYNSSPSRFTVKPSQTYYGGSTRCTVLLDNKFEFNIYINILRYGDLNGDGAVNSQDALLVLRYSVSLEKFDANQKKYADVSADSLINSTDALYILNYSVGKISIFNAEK